MIPIRLPVLHGGERYPSGWLHSDWVPDPLVVLLAFGAAAAYVLFTGSLNAKRPDAADRPVTAGQRVMFLSGCAAFLIALSPPIDDWADAYLLTAHMFQHMVLMFVVAPLLLAGTPSWMLEPLTRRPIMNRLGYLLTRPVVALVAANAIVIGWHIPGVYNAALESDPIHAAQHLSFLAAAILGWWPVLGPLAAWPRLVPPLRCLYLFLFSLPGGVVGAAITLAAPGMYDFYMSAPRVFDISVGTDQQLAGLMMWVGGSTIYLLWITVIFLTWASAEEAKDREAPRSGVPASDERGRVTAGT